MPDTREMIIMCGMTDHNPAETLVPGSTPEVNPHHRLPEGKRKELGQIAALLSPNPVRKPAQSARKSASALTGVAGTYAPGRVARFWSKIDKDNGPTHPTLGRCWPWRRALNKEGYGQTAISGDQWMTHRLAYELSVGPIPPGLTIDHKCRLRSCCNPGHLEPVTSYVNVMRGVGWAAKNIRKESCAHGHRFSEENTLLVDRGRSGMERRCKTCDEASALHRSLVRWTAKHESFGEFELSDVIPLPSHEWNQTRFGTDRSKRYSRTRELKALEAAKLATARAVQS